MSKAGTVVCDANILIDYCQTDISILKLAAERCYDICIPSSVFHEVRQLTHEMLGELNLRKVDESFEQIMEAQNNRSALSVADYVCFLLAKNNNWTCATNEKALFNKCRKENVDVIRGLTLMVDLHNKAALSRKRAISVAKQIKQINDRITHRVIADFIELLDTSRSRE